MTRLLAVGLLAFHSAVVSSDTDQLILEHRSKYQHIAVLKDASGKHYMQLNGDTQNHEEEAYLSHFFLVDMPMLMKGDAQSMVCYQLLILYLDNAPLDAKAPTSVSRLNSSYSVAEMASLHGTHCSTRVCRTS